MNDFYLPSYREIPDVGLFLEQVSKYIGGYLDSLGSINLTGSMISNYVKQKIIKNPIKKQYDREQIACLIFIAIAKSVLSLEDIQLMLHIQQEAYSSETAYDYFREHLMLRLDQVCGGQQAPLQETSSDVPAENTSKEAQLLDNVITAIAHKVYLDNYFREMRTSE